LLKPRSCDEGHQRVIENFVHYYNMLEEHFQSLGSNAELVFNVDEVGIQIAE
jgi:hypothetical protein